MRGSTGDRFWQREPIAPTLVPSREEEIPETRATLGQFCPILHYVGIVRRVFGNSRVIRSIFSTCNALGQDGLPTLPDVPPSVCYPSGRHRQRSRPKPGGQRNLDPRIGRERASRHGDCQHHGGRGPAVRDRSIQVKC